MPQTLTIRYQRSKGMHWCKLQQVSSAHVHSSLQSGQCLTMNCTYRHVRGTTRTNSHQNSTNRGGKPDDLNRYNMRGNTRTTSHTKSTNHGGNHNDLNGYTNSRSSYRNNYNRQYPNSNRNSSNEHNHENSNQVDWYHNTQQTPQQNVDFLGMMQNMRQDLMSAMENQIAQATAQLTQQIKLFLPQSQAAQHPQHHLQPQQTSLAYNQTPQHHLQMQHQMMPPNHHYLEHSVS